MSGSSRLLRHPAWKLRGPIPVSALHKSITYLLNYSYRVTRMTSWRSHRPLLHKQGFFIHVTMNFDLCSLPSKAT